MTSSKKNKIARKFYGDIGRIKYLNLLLQNIKWTSTSENICDQNLIIYIRYDNDNMKEMFPNDARIRNLTYKSNIFCNVGIQYIFHKTNEKDKIVNFDKINILFL